MNIPWRTIGTGMADGEVADLTQRAEVEALRAYRTAVGRRTRDVVVVDNATSHVEQMAPFVALVQADPLFATSLVPVGNGEFLAVRASS